MADGTPGPGPRGSKAVSLPRPITLITLAGEVLPIEVDPAAHTCLRNFENAVMAVLPYLGRNPTLGCELQFVRTDTYQVLTDPIQSKLSATHSYYVVAQPCFVEAAHSKGSPKLFESRVVGMTKSHRRPSPFTRRSVMSKLRTVSGL